MNDKEHTVELLMDKRFDDHEIMCAAAFALGLLARREEVSR